MYAAARMIPHAPPPIRATQRLHPQFVKDEIALDLPPDLVISSPCSRFKLAWLYLIHKAPDPGLARLK
jgi:hypothetical protein